MWSLERHQEAHDLVIQAWTRPGPFAFEGKHFHFEYVNVWPRPFQQPHPPIWCPSQGSLETIEWAAHPDRKYVYLQTYSPRESVQRYLDLYRHTAAARYGYAAGSDKIGWCVPAYVGETDEQAIAEARPHLEAMFNVFLPKVSELMFFPPGYMSNASLKNILAHKPAARTQRATIEDLIAKGIVIIGSPDTVRRKLTEAHERMGFQELLIMPQFGTMPGDLVEANIRRFATHVMPALKALSDREYRGFEPASAAAG